MRWDGQLGFAMLRDCVVWKKRIESSEETFLAVYPCCGRTGTPGFALILEDASGPNLVAAWSGPGDPDHIEDIFYDLEEHECLDEDDLEAIKDAIDEMWENCEDLA